MSFHGVVNLLLQSVVQVLLIGPHVSPGCACCPRQCPGTTIVITDRVAGSLGPGPSPTRATPHPLTLLLRWELSLTSPPEIRQGSAELVQPSQELVQLLSGVRFVVNIVVVVVVSGGGGQPAGGS